LLVAGGLAVCSSPNVPAFWMFVLLACEGVGNTFVSIARPVIMRDAIPAQVAENAASWSSLGRRIVSVGGPFLAGFLIETTGNAALAFSVSCIFLVLSIASDFPIRLPHRPRHEEAPTLHAITEGLRFMRRSPLVLSATLLDMFAVLLGGATALLPIFAKDILHVGPTVYGWLWASPSLGSAIMAFILTRRPPLKRAGHTLLLSVTGFGVMTIVFGLSRDVYLSFFALLMTGVFDALSVSIRSTILQLHVPDHLRGRVYGVNMIFVYSSNDLGEFESGTTAAFLGPVGSVVTGGIGAIIVAAIFGWRWPQLRTMRSLKPSLSEGHGSPSGV
jgi:MFS family permease